MKIRLLLRIVSPKQSPLLYKYKPTTVRQSLMITLFQEPFGTPASKLIKQKQKHLRGGFLKLSFKANILVN